MKIVFFGTSEFASSTLRKLLESRHTVSAVVTQPDTKKGRDLKVSPPPIKVFALSKHIPVYQPIDASGPDALAYLKKIPADLFVVVSFGQILTKEVLSLPERYALNIHGSLLPKYRGAAPTNWAIMSGERSSGITIMKMNERMDEGDIILQESLPIDLEDTNITLSEKLSELGAEALLSAIGLIEQGKAHFTPQDDTQATYAPKLKKSDGLIRWDDHAMDIHNKVRGLLPWPGAYTSFGGKTLKILKTSLIDLPPAPDVRNGGVIEVIKHKGICIKTPSGELLLEYVQIEGKRAMDATSFVCGHRIKRGYQFGT